MFSTVALSAALLRAARARLLSWTALAVALLPVGVGAAGMMIGRSSVERAIESAFADPSQFVAIGEEGYRDAGACVTIGLALAAMPLLLAAGALVAAYAFRVPAGGPRAAEDR